MKLVKLELGFHQPLRYPLPVLGQATETFFTFADVTLFTARHLYLCCLPHFFKSPNPVIKFGNFFLEISLRQTASQL